MCNRCQTAGILHHTCHYIVGEIHLYSLTDSFRCTAEQLLGYRGGYHCTVSAAMKVGLREWLAGKEFKVEHLEEISISRQILYTFHTLSVRQLQKELLVKSYCGHRTIFPKRIKPFFCNTSRYKSTGYFTLCTLGYPQFVPMVFRID